MAVGTGGPEERAVAEVTGAVVQGEKGVEAIAAARGEDEAAEAEDNKEEL